MKPSLLILLGAFQCVSAKAWSEISEDFPTENNLPYLTSNGTDYQSKSNTSYNGESMPPISTNVSIVSNTTEGEMNHAVSVMGMSPGKYSWFLAMILIPVSCIVAILVYKKILPWMRQLIHMRVMRRANIPIRQHLLELKETEEDADKAVLPAELWTTYQPTINPPDEETAHALS